MSEPKVISSEPMIRAVIKAAAKAAIKESILKRRLFAKKRLDALDASTRLSGEDFNTRIY